MKSSIRYSILFLILASSFTNVLNSPTINSYILPHGSEILNPETSPDYPLHQSLHDNMKTISSDINNFAPELILFVTPHGHALSKSHCIYLNTNGYGNPDDDHKKFDSKVIIDSENSNKLLNFLEENGNDIPFEGLTSYGDDEPINLRWAEIVPIWFIQELNANKSNLREISKSSNKFKFIFFSVSNRRKVTGDQMVNEMIKIGKLTHEFLSNLPLSRIAVVISADLAHTHKITHGQKMGTEPYGVTEESQPFDDFIQAWASNPLEEANIVFLRDNASKILMKALSCGYLGIVLLSEFLISQAKSLNVGKSTEFTSEVLINCHPTYFGMMIARFYQLNSNKLILK